MKKFLLSLCLLMLSVTCHADQRTTVLDDVSTNGTGKVVLPYIDGSNDTYLEAALNKLIKEEAQALLKKAGKNASLSYEVTLNRPSLVSIILKAEGNNTCYKGLNLDLTTGKPFTLNDFFVKNDKVKDTIALENFVLDEAGILYPKNNYALYENKLPYGDVLENVRVSEAGRIFQVARLTNKSENKTLHLVGDSLAAIKLASNPSTGYSWQITPSAGVKEVGRSFNMPSLGDGRTGIPGEEIIVFAVKGKGMHNINFQYKRAWERSFAQSFNVKIEVD